MRNLKTWLARKLLGSSKPQADAAAPTDFQLLAESSADVILRVGPDMRASYASPACFAIFGYTPEEMLGRTPADIYLPEDLGIIQAAAASLYQQGTPIASPIARVQCKDGTVKWCESKAQLLKGSTDGLGDVVVVLRDVTERVRLEKQMEALAKTDGLTSLANRRAFDEALDREWRNTVRTGRPTSLLLLDIDHFKAFNDRYGHQAGDDCLRVVAAAITASVRRPRDFAARYGGEEFATILPETDAAGALEVAEQVRKAIETLRVPHAGNPEGGGWITVSVGVATAVSGVSKSINIPDGLLLAADGALYKAKRNGRNRVDVSVLRVPTDPRRGLHLAAS